MSARGSVPAHASLQRRPSRATFLFRKWVTGFRVSGAPHLDAQALPHFREVLAHTTHYLEYGSGVSTLVAWQVAQSVVTVDNDRRYLRAVAKALASASASPERFNLIHVDTGITKQWGFPLFRAPTPRRLQRWRRYAAAPWAFLDAHAIQPDTILVDGRFRVACVLESLLHLRDGSPCTILVDDYADRPEYAVVEAFATRVSIHGLMATLRMRPDFDRAACLRVLPQYHRDWR